MDGLLLDSERLARDTFVAACLELGCNPDLTVYDRCVGTTSDATERILTAGLGPEFPFREVRACWSALYQARALNEPIDVKPGALELLALLTEHGIPCGLATSTRRDLASVKLSNAGLRGFFAALVCGGDTQRGKPHPDPYLYAAEGLQVRPMRCLALEDSDNGVRAAHAAGMQVIQIPDLIEPSAEVRALGHLVVRSLHDVTAWMGTGGIL